MSLMIPEKLKIGHATWTIKRNHELIDREENGCTHHQLQEIHIRSAMTEQKEEETLFHEILHACWDFVGLERDHEEDTINRLTPILLTVLKENPKLFSCTKKVNVFPKSLDSIKEAYEK